MVIIIYKNKREYRSFSQHSIHLFRGNFQRLFGYDNRPQTPKYDQKYFQVNGNRYPNLDIVSRSPEIYETEVLNRLPNRKKNFQIHPKIFIYPFPKFFPGPNFKKLFFQPIPLPLKTFSLILQPNMNLAKRGL